MLQIKDIRKQYITGELVQTALDGVSLNLRDNEFVAILGPSGSGKTTLLNVIGGLDRYDSGDLIINGISTKKYTDRDWDSYRNHTIGFVFQSYNLIPHQSVLANVELALTISGISRSERRRRAQKALEDVGLGNQLHKKPNQMSGGQMQRVAIARALVNDPDILLADEPTGALDSETSVQVMDLLKEVSKDRLVVMVTHNPELAEDYANRIVRVKDGRIIGDTNPFEVDETILAAPQHKNLGKSSMSFMTALALSFNNLRTKLARTLLTAFAGSIGIIGIAAIMSLSTGFQKYIDKIQEDTLSNYPLTIQADTADMTSALAMFGASVAEASQLPDGVVGEQQMISSMFAQIGSNDLAGFKTHLEENYDTIGHTINTVKYSYGVQPRIFTADTDSIMQVNPSTFFSDLMAGAASMSGMMDTNVFYELIDNTALLEAQYEVVMGHWPENYNEMVFVLTDPSQLTDYIAYAIGIKPVSVLEGMMQSLVDGKEPQDPGKPLQWTYEELMGLQFKLVNASDLYRYNSEYKVWEDMSDDKNFMKARIGEGEELSIVGIVCPREGVSATTLTSGIAYTKALTEYVIEQSKESTIVQSQLEDMDIDVFTGKKFGEQSDGSQLSFENMISIDEEVISSAFGMNISTDSIMSLLQNYMSPVLSSLVADTGPARDAFLLTLGNMGKQMLHEQIAAGGGEGRLYLNETTAIVDDYLASPGAVAQIEALTANYALTAEDYTQTFQPLLNGLLTSCITSQLSGEGVALVPSESNSSASAVSQEEVPVTEASAESEPLPSEVPATEAPATEAPTTEAPTTEAPTTEAPTTEAPTTEAPVMEAPTTEASTAEAPETEAPETEAITPEIPTIPEIEVDILYITITADAVDGIVNTYLTNPLVTGTASAMATGMTRNDIMQTLTTQLSGFTNVLTNYIGSAFYVDEEKMASAFQFNMTEEDLMRLMQTMSGKNQEVSAAANLKSLGYAKLEEPTSISIYMVDFAAKEEFMDFLDAYNADMEESGNEDSVIRYTDVTGIMMSSVRTIIDSVSYALIAFVAVSLVVSSIMIGIITYISVMERTKEIGVLRAIGASKRNISQVFNAETFIIGLCSGLIGIGVTLLLLIPGNQLILYLTNNPDIVAQLPVANALVLILLSMVLTLIGGFIPARQAAKKDPVIALRSE